SNNLGGLTLESGRPHRAPRVAGSTSTMSGCRGEERNVCADSLERLCNPHARNTAGCLSGTRAAHYPSERAPGAQREYSVAHACRRKSRTTVPTTTSAEERTRADLRCAADTVSASGRGGPPGWVIPKTIDGGWRPFPFAPQTKFRKASDDRYS